MLSIEKLKAKRNKEAERYNKEMKVIRVKQNIKKDIRNIRAARLRGKVGFIKSKPDVPRVKKDTGTFLKTVGRVGYGLLDGIKMLGDIDKKDKREVKTK